jgi:hypothetical protein
MFDDRGEVGRCLAYFGAGGIVTDQAVGYEYSSALCSVLSKMMDRRVAFNLVLVV